MIDNEKKQIYHAINAGILGGNSIEFIRTYSKYVIDFYNTQKDEFSLIGEKKGLLNIILEQLSFGILAKKANLKIECLKDILDFDELINDIIDIYSAPIRSKFVHCLGNIKKDLLVAQQIEFHLKSQYPIYYQKILKYCEKNGFGSDIDLHKYNQFEEVYHLLSSYENVDLLMTQVRFRLKPDFKVISNSNGLCLVTPTGNIPLSGWGKMMRYLDRYRTGNELSNELYADLKNHFREDEIQENVFSYLLHTLYRGKFIEYIM